jgi:hypothetical protein
MEKTYIDADHHRGNQILDDIQEQIFQNTQLDIIVKLQPSFSKDGNQYCYLYGTLPNDCVVGYGETAYLAMRDFVKNFHSQKA